jgi:UDP-N-acetylglucosamine acyltransferase
MNVHPTAIIAPTATLAEDVEIGPYVVIGEHSHIGPGSRLASHVVIGDYTRIGARCHIFSHAVLGATSQDRKYREGETSWLEIGDENMIRECVTINRATAQGCTTRLGNNNLLMAYVHIAHDCTVGNQVIVANSANIGGHAVLEDGAVIGAMSGIHQFTRIGRLAMVGAMSRVVQDIPPYMLAVGIPPKVYGINTVGLRRQGVPLSHRQQLKQAYHILYRRQLNVSHALEQLSCLDQVPELQHLIAFVRASERGIVSLYQADPGA